MPNQTLRNNLQHQLNVAKNRLQQLQKCRSKVDSLEAICLVQKINEIEFKLHCLSKI